MAPYPSAPDVADQEHPVLLNEKFKVHCYDGGAFKSRGQYDVKNVLVPIIESFHCSASGTKFNLVLKCTAPEDFTLTHFYVSGPGPRCTEPIRSGLVWVTEEPLEPESLKKYDHMTSEELMEIMKGLRHVDDGMAKSAGLPEPCVYFKTDPNSREVESELSKWREGKYVAIKFLDTHKDQANIDVGVVGLIGFFGRRAAHQVPLGPWMRRTVRQTWVHPNPLKSMFSTSGWVCDGRDFTGGCRSGQTDFHQTSVYTVTFRCTSSGFDLCEHCARDPLLGRVTDTSIQADLEALADPATCKLATMRLRNLWRRNWPTILPKYFSQGFLDVLLQALRRSMEGAGRQDEERVASQRQHSQDAQRRHMRRALLQLTLELTLRLFSLSLGGDLAVNDVCLAHNPESEQPWEEGRVVQLPGAFADTCLSWGQPSAERAGMSHSASSTFAADEPLVDTARPAALRGPEAAAPDRSDGTYLVAWRSSQSTGRVPAHSVWKLTAEDEVMTATANLFSEVSKSGACDIDRVQKFLQQGADLQAVNGEGNTALLVAIRNQALPEVVALLLESGACPDVTGRDGATPLQIAWDMRAEGRGSAAALQQCADALLRHGATAQEADVSLEERIGRLRETFGLNICGALLSLQTPTSMPIELLEVLHLLFRELPLGVVQQSLEPEALRALSALLHHVVGGTDSLSTAALGCRIARALWSRGDPTLRRLIQNHGVVRWARRLSSMRHLGHCGLYRHAHHEKVSMEGFWRELQAFVADLQVVGDCALPAEEDAWRANKQLHAIVSALETCGSDVDERVAVAAREALCSLDELLRKIEKEAPLEECCTPYDLERCCLPGHLLRFLKQPTAAEGSAVPPAEAAPGVGRCKVNRGDNGADFSDALRRPTASAGRWTAFMRVFDNHPSPDQRGFARLVKVLHAMVEMGEVFPVWRHKREKGLRALTEPLPLRLRPAIDAGTTEAQLTPLLPRAMYTHLVVPVEPLASVEEVSQYLLKVTPCVDPQYLAYCNKLVGATISDMESGERSVVVSFEVTHSLLPLPIHTLQSESTGTSQRVLLAVRDYRVVSTLPPADEDLDFCVALNRLHAIGGPGAYPSLLDDLGSALSGEPRSAAPRAAADSGTAPVADGSEGNAGEGAAGVGGAGAAAVSAAVSKAEVRAADDAQHVLGQAAAAVAAAGRVDEALALLAAERERVAPATAPSMDVECSNGEPSVDASMRVHTVMIAVSEEIPFELFWPMVREDVMATVQELQPQAIPQMEEAVQAGVSQNGMGPVAQRLTLEEAKLLAARIGHVVQTAVTVDQKAVENVRKERAKATSAEAFLVGTRVQFSAKSGKWSPGVVVGHGTPGAAKAACNVGERYDLIDDTGVLWERVPQNRVRLPPRPQRRESAGSQGAAMPTAVLSQSDLMRIQEHLRRRQEEWTERHTQLSNAGAVNAAGASSGTNVAPDPTGSSRPTSAPAIAQRLHGSVISALEVPGSGGRQGVSGELSSRDDSLAEIDPTGALEMVNFIDEEGIGDEDYDDDGEGGQDGDEGDEDDEDLPPLEPSEAGDSQVDVMGAPRPGGRDANGDADVGVSSMEDELRVLDQLRAMEQIMSEFLDPQQEGGGAPVASLQIRMRTGAADGRVETYQVRRASDSRGSDRGGGGRGGASERGSAEPLRGHFPAFLRATDAPNPTSSLDHPVVERLGAADLQVKDADPKELAGQACDEGSKPPRLVVRFCLQPLPPAAAAASATMPAAAPAAAAPAAGDVASSPAAAGDAEAGEPPPAPMSLPATWSLLKAMQFLQDQQYSRSSALVGNDARALDSAAVPLDRWSLGFSIDMTEASTRLVAPAESGAQSAGTSGAKAANDSSVDNTVAAAHQPSGTNRRCSIRSGKQGALTDEVAREIYRSFASETSAEGDSTVGPHAPISRCGDNCAVTDAIELLHLLWAQGPHSGVDPNMWVSSKLDRKLRYQLEDPLSVVSGTLPHWATTLPRLCPFLFSLKTRKMFLKYTAFGPSFAVHWTQDNKVGSFLRRRATVQTELNAQTDPRKMQALSQELSNIEEHVVKSSFWLGALQSTLARMQKGEEFLKQSMVAMELVAASGHLLEVQFDGETGFGSAVTQSFYVEVAQTLQDRDVNRRAPMWVEDDNSTSSRFLLCRRGLFFRPLVAGPQLDEAVRRFRFLGRCMGQALREGFIVPLPLSEEFFALVLGEHLGSSSLPRPGGGTAGELVGVLADFVADLKTAEARSWSDGTPPTEDQLLAWRKEQAQRPDFAERFLHRHDGSENAPNQAMSFDEYVSCVDASFLETGLGGAPLCPEGENVAVTIENVEDFVAKASTFWFETGVVAQVDAFRAGLNDVFPVGCLATFGRSELREMFCGEDRVEWDEQALLAHLHPSGGLTSKSPTYRFLVAELLDMSQADRARFLDFVSSCPRLPPGGIAKFNVDVFPDNTATRQGFPRSRACANQVYLPPYTSREELHERLHEAMHSSAGHHEQRVRDM